MYVHSALAVQLTNIHTKDMIQGFQLVHFPEIVLWTLLDFVSVQEVSKTTLEYCQVINSIFCFDPCRMCLSQLAVPASCYFPDVEAFGDRGTSEEPRIQN